MMREARSFGLRTLWPSGWRLVSVRGWTAVRGFRDISHQIIVDETVVLLAYQLQYQLHVQVEVVMGDTVAHADDGVPMLYLVSVYEAEGYQGLKGIVGGDGNRLPVCP